MHRSRFTRRIAGKIAPIVLIAMGMNILIGSMAWAQTDRSFGDFGGRFAGGFGGLDDQGSVVSLSAEFTAPTSPDQPGVLFIKAKIEPGWHISSITQLSGGPIITTIQVDESQTHQLVGHFLSYPSPTKKPEPAFNNLIVESHEGTVFWYAPVEFAPGVKPSSVQIAGHVRVGPCSDTTCRSPEKLAFTAKLGTGKGFPMVNPSDFSESVPEQPITPEAKTADRVVGSIARHGDELPWEPFTMKTFLELVGSDFDPATLNVNLRARQSGSPLLLVLSYAFLGGILLNLMPCVLPVIGLKILSFVEQSGHDRRRAFLLNMSYSAGLLAVFLILALLAVFMNLGWGYLFRYAGFNIVMAAVIFVMGLAFLGVWEIPIPGFIGSGKSVELAEKEGLSGAFLKGVITTILATPCTGPFMGTALAWAMNQSAVQICLVFFCVGLGMASPYLAIGLMPGLMRFLPRPGAWMDLFKQLMGFVLLGTVVYILTFLEWHYIVPTIGLLFALWAGCWWINRVPPTEDFGRRFRAWAAATAMVGISWLILFPGINEVSSGRFAFRGLHDIMKDRYEEDVESTFVQRMQSQGLILVNAEQKKRNPQAVLVDFTADWCPNCKTLESTVLNTSEVRQAVEAHNVVTMKADITHDSPEVAVLMKWLGVKQLPVLAIFSPWKDPNRPTVFSGGWYQQADILTAIEQTAAIEQPSGTQPE